MKNCNAPIETSQKTLLKVLKCLWKQNIVCRTFATKQYFANPNETNYYLMVNELNAIGAVINNSQVFTVLDCSGNPLTASIVTANAVGEIAYNYSDPSGNTWENVVNNKVATWNLGTTKPVQNLNMDECLKSAYQVKPMLFNGVAVTQAVVTERTGCTGVANTGFLELSINGDINCFKFNACHCENTCFADKKC